MMKAYIVNGICLKDRDSAIVLGNSPTPFETDVPEELLTIKSEVFVDRIDSFIVPYEGKAEFYLYSNSKFNDIEIYDKVSIEFEYDEGYDEPDNSVGHEGGVFCDNLEIEMVNRNYKFSDLSQELQDKITQLITDEINEYLKTK